MKKGGVELPEMATATDVLARLSQVENQIQASGRELINTREDRKRHVDYLLGENQIESAREYVRNLAKLTGGKKRTYRRKQTRKNKKHGKKV